MDWFKDYCMVHGKLFPWIVKFAHKSGEVEELQLCGNSAQEVVDYIRETYPDTEMIYYIAKVDNSWN